MHNALFWGLLGLHASSDDAPWENPGKYQTLQNQLIRIVMGVCGISHGIHQNSHAFPQVLTCHCTYWLSALGELRLYRTKTRAVSQVMLPLIQWCAARKCRSYSRMSHYNGPLSAEDASDTHLTMQIWGWLATFALTVVCGFLVIATLQPHRFSDNYKLIFEFLTSGRTKRA